MDYPFRCADLRLRYPRVIEASFVISLMIISATFLLSKEFPTGTEQVVFDNVVIKVQDIPITHQIKRPPPPPRPTIPIEADEPLLEPDATISDRVWNAGNIYPPPPMDDDSVIFLPVEQQPKLIGGEAAIMQYIMDHNLFPAMALKAGVGGECFIRFVVDKNGITRNLTIHQEKPTGLGFGEAGIRVMEAMRFIPAIQRDRPVKVHMQQHIKFVVR